ncbi:MAG: HNH endonuclease [Cyanobacteria bacterium SIG29]|nr:HNH endonuclease [Cyanobacteria bacterium SIG29]
MSSPKLKKITEEEYLKYYFDIPHEGSTSAGKPLRKLKNVICPYRGIKIIPCEQIAIFEKKLLKVKTAFEAIELLSFYHENMLPTEKMLFAIFSDFVKLNPDDNLQNCLKMIRESALTRLKLEQMEVLDDVDILTRKLCSKTALEVRAQTVKCRQLIISNTQRGFFKRKNFLASLENIVPLENERETLNDIKNKALFLPTSESSKNAFIVKYSKRSQIEIARRLFIASSGTIEHVVPASMGGANTISNFLLTCAGGNRYRENMPLPEYIKRHPKIPEYAQDYIDCIIDAIHNRQLQGNETYPYKIKKRLFEESLGRINISLAEYTYSEEDAICAVKEYEQRYLKYKK